MKNVNDVGKMKKFSKLEKMKKLKNFFLILNDKWILNNDKNEKIFEKFHFQRFYFWQNVCCIWILIDSYYSMLISYLRCRPLCKRFKIISCMPKFEKEKNCYIILKIINISIEMKKRVVLLKNV